MEDAAAITLKQKAPTLSVKCTGKEKNFHNSL